MIRHDAHRPIGLLFLAVFGPGPFRNRTE